MTTCIQRFYYFSQAEADRSGWKLITVQHPSDSATYEIKYTSVSDHYFIPDGLRTVFAGACDPGEIVFYTQCMPAGKSDTTAQPQPAGAAAFLEFNTHYYH